MLVPILILTGGVHAFAFAIFHLLFWKLFAWPKDLAALHFSNRAIMQILNVQLIVFFLVVACLCFFFTAELAGTALGKAVLLAIALFWLVRTIQQFIFLRVNDRRVHLLTFFFILGTLIFSGAWLVA